jgi:hypothetical protein
MEWKNNAQQSNLNVNELIENNRRLREYNEELQLLLDKANEQLQKGNIPNVNSTVKNCEETASELRKFARVIADIKSMFDELEIYGSLDEECRQRMEKKLCCDIDEIADHYFDLGQKDIQKGLQKLLGIRF